MSFVSPVWDSANNHYVIELLPAFMERLRVLIKKDSTGSTVFSNADAVENITDSVIHTLIDEGSKGSWFSKLPSHDQLIKRVRHTFKNLAKESDNGANLSTLLLTPKQVTLLWNPVTFTPARTIPQIEFDDSGSESSEGDAVEIPESDLPPVRLTDDTQETHEQYLLTRLRAARARVEEEQIRMQYFEATGRMPPDSDSEDE